MSERPPTPDEVYARTHMQALEELYRGEIGFPELPESKIEDYLMGQTAVIVHDTPPHKYKIDAVDVKHRVVGLFPLGSNGQPCIIPWRNIRLYAVFEKELERRMAKLSKQS